MLLTALLYQIKTLPLNAFGNDDKGGDNVQFLRGGVIYEKSENFHDSSLINQPTDTFIIYVGLTTTIHV